MTAADAYSLAHHFYETDQLAAAEQMFRQVLELDPDDAAALHGLGRIAFRSGDPHQAVDFLQRATENAPADADSWNDLGAACCLAGNFAAGAQASREALRLRPACALAFRNLGYALFHQGDYEQAVAVLREALRLQPDLADAHGNLGAALQALDRPAEAAAALEQAFRLNPTSAYLANSAGMAYELLSDFERAIAFYRLALRLKPDFPDALNNLATCYSELGCFDEAIDQLNEAERARPDYACARDNRIIILQRQGRLDEAIALLREALRLKPFYAYAHYNLSLLLLLCGNFEEGWREYEWRWQTKDFPSYQRPEPPWDGGPLDGKTILLHPEQGLGDTFQFIRYASLVKERGATVVVDCPPELRGVLNGCPGIDRLIPHGEPLPACDVQAALMSLPGLCGTTLTTIPAETPYLTADAACVAHLRKRLDVVPGFKVGICWQGRPSHRNDRRRSVPLARFAPLAEVPGVRLVSLQRGPGRDQWDTHAEQWPVVELPALAEEPSEAWRDTAALIRALDLVITVDTAVAHLAGALAAPVWVALPFCPDWRWLLERNDSPWYPTMRLFRQTRGGDWTDVFARIATELQVVVAERHAKCQVLSS
jgi:tetratricopeptide (TPR) repeat protein